MREIKFRGMSHGDWYYGDLITAYDKDKKKHYYIITEDYESKGTNIELNTCASPEVEQETVGQYTGLHDKNGKEIYEGDIVQYSDIYNGVVEYSEKYAQFILKETGIIADECEALGEFNIKVFEVIGNIYENKELLEG